MGFGLRCKRVLAPNRVQSRLGQTEPAEGLTEALLWHGKNLHGLCCLRVARAMPKKGLASALGVLRLLLSALDWPTKGQPPNANKKNLDSLANVLRLSNVNGDTARDVTTRR